MLAKSNLEAVDSIKQTLFWCSENTKENLENLDPLIFLSKIIELFCSFKIFCTSYTCKGANDKHKIWDML